MSESWRPTLAADRMLLQVRAIHAGYVKLDILHGMPPDVGRGELVGIIGPNGSGKSPTLKSIIGFLHPKSGHIVFDGKEILGLRCDEILRLGLASVPQGRIVFPQMTVGETLAFGPYI